MIEAAMGFVLVVQVTNEHSTKLRRLEVTLVAPLRSPDCANCEAIGSRFTPEMSSYRLPVSGKAVICGCPVLHESVFYSCSLSCESFADHSLGKEENRFQWTVDSGQWSACQQVNG
jgi:hypothetical protein